MTVTTRSVAQICAAAKRASRTLALLDGATRNAALERIAQALAEHAEEILDANRLDLEAGRAHGLSAALIDRLKLDRRRLESIAAGVRATAALADPVGELISGSRRPNGLEIRQLRVPLGVVAVVYEARPNVTIDAAALCLKSGNAVVLRGSSTAEHSNAALGALAREAIIDVGLPADAIGVVGGGHEQLAELASQTGTVDLIIPRGGEALKAALEAVASVPVLYAASGNCHVYIDARADLDAALAITLNAKLQRPGVCNAAETLLVHERAAAQFLPKALHALCDAGVTVHADARSRALAPELSLLTADAQDWDTEYLALELAVGVVDSLEQAIDHINTHGSGHSEAIVTEDIAAARAFQAGVDAACVYVNASTRFTDGGQFGMGAEIGISTQKLHARGPIGLRELCTTKYLIEGAGQIRA